MATQLDSFLEFYQKILRPEFDAIKEKQAEHDVRFSEPLDHFDSLYHRLGRLEDEYLFAVAWSPGNNRAAVGNRLIFDVSYDNL